MCQLKAMLRCCASCEWIYKGHTPCPKCGFASYGARHVHGNKAYKYAVTQQAWIERKIATYLAELQKEVRNLTAKEGNIVRVSKFSCNAIGGKK